MSHYRIHKYENTDDYYDTMVAEILFEDYINPLMQHYLDNPNEFKIFDDDVKAWVKAGKPDDWNFK